MSIVNPVKRKEWRVYFSGREWLIVRWGDLQPGEQAMPDAGGVAAQLLHAGVDTFTHQTLLDLWGDFSSTLESPDEEWHELCRRLDEEFRRGSLVVVQGTARVKKGSGGTALPPAPKKAEDKPGPVVKKKKKTWVAIRLVDQSNIPVVNEPYKIVLPDNSLRDGNTNDAGEAWIEDIEDPGTCKVSFPNIDAREWSGA